MPESKSLEERVRALEQSVSKYDGSIAALKWAAGIAAALGLGGIIWAALTTFGKVETHSVKIEKLEKDLARAEADNAALRTELRNDLRLAFEKAENRIERVDGRLSGWEARNFKPVGAQALVRDAAFVSLAGDKITVDLLDPDGKKYDRATLAAGDPKYVKLAQSLKPGDRLRVMEAPGERLGDPWVWAVFTRDDQPPKKKP